jgi:hypothetical protein
MQNNYKIDEKPPVFARNSDLQQKREIPPSKRIRGESGFLAVLYTTMKKEVKKR